MDIDQMQNELVDNARKNAIEFLENGRLKGEFNGGLDRMLENEGYIRLCAIILRGDGIENIRKALREEMFSERHCEALIEQNERFAIAQHQRWKMEDQS